MGLSNFLDAMQSIFIFFSNAAIINIKMQLLMELREVNMLKGNADKYQVTSWHGVR